MDPVVVGMLRAALAFVFAQAAFHKLRDPAGFSAVVRGHALLPDAVSPAVTGALIVGESIAALALLAPISAGLGATTALVLLAVYSLAIGGNLARGRRDVDCGCLGPGQRQTLTPWLLVRNGILAASALACLVPVSTRSVTWIDVVSTLAGASVLVLLFLAATRLAATGSAAIGSERSA